MVPEIECLAICKEMGFVISVRSPRVFKFLFLQDKGYYLENEYMMSRFVGLASSDRKHEIIIYYIEMLRKHTGHTLEELESSVDKEETKKIRSELIDRSKKSFIIIKG